MLLVKSGITLFTSFVSSVAYSIPGPALLSGLIPSNKQGLRVSRGLDINIYYTYEVVGDNKCVLIFKLTLGENGILFELHCWIWNYVI